MMEINQVKHNEENNQEAGFPVGTKNQQLTLREFEVMGSRRNSRNIPPSYDERIRHESEMMHHHAHHHEQLPPPELFEDKWAAQAAELQQLISDNQKLSTGQLALRQEHAAAVGEVDKIREHIQRIRTEGDIQIHIMLDKIAKTEADIRARDNKQRELQEARIELRSVVKSKSELSTKVEQATKEQEHSRANTKKLPEMRDKLDSLKEEYILLRKTFEQEKGQNVEKVEQMKLLENELIEIAGEVERLRSEVSNAEKRANAPIPYGGPNMDPGNYHPPPFYVNGGGYFEGFGGQHLLHTYHGAPMQIMNPYTQVINGSGGGADGGFAVGNQVMSGGGSVWGGVYDTSHTQQ